MYDVQYLYICKMDSVYTVYNAFYMHNKQVEFEKKSQKSKAILSVFSDFRGSSYFWTMKNVGCHNLWVFFWSG